MDICVACFIHILHLIQDLPSYTHSKFSNIGCHGILDTDPSVWHFALDFRDFPGMSQGVPGGIPIPMCDNSHNPSALTIGGCKG